MSETPVEYRDRLWRTLGSQDPLAVLARTPLTLGRWMETASPEQWKRSTKSSHWTPSEILAHLAEGEIVFSFRLRMTVRASGSPLQPYDQNAWVENSEYLVNNPQLALELFQTLRKANVAFIEALPASAKELFGIHGERGKETVSDLLRLCAGHDLNHLRQLEERLKEQRPQNQ